jgi:hypothetical protein
MIAASIKVAQSPQDLKTSQVFETSTKDVVTSLLELKKVCERERDESLDLNGWWAR